MDYPCQTDEDEGRARFSTVTATLAMLVELKEISGGSRFVFPVFSVFLHFPFFPFYTVHFH
jgi:hypothetical protein